jgi:hypothetical protein
VSVGPIGRVSVGVYQLISNVWEWTRGISVPRLIRRQVLLDAPLKNIRPAHRHLLRRPGDLRFRAANCRGEKAQHRIRCGGGCDLVRREQPPVDAGISPETPVESAYDSRCHLPMESYRLQYAIPIHATSAKPRTPSTRILPELFGSDGAASYRPLSSTEMVAVLAPAASEDHYCTRHADGYARERPTGCNAGRAFSITLQQTAISAPPAAFPESPMNPTAGTGSTAGSAASSTNTTPSYRARHGRRSPLAEVDHPHSCKQIDVSQECRGVVLIDAARRRRNPRPGLLHDEAISYLAELCESERHWRAPASGSSKSTSVPVHRRPDRLCPPMPPVSGLLPGAIQIHRRASRERVARSRLTDGFACRCGWNRTGSPNRSVALDQLGKRRR